MSVLIFVLLVLTAFTKDVFAGSDTSTEISSAGNEVRVDGEGTVGKSQDIPQNERPEIIPFLTLIKKSLSDLSSRIANLENVSKDVLQKVDQIDTRLSRLEVTSALACKLGSVPQNAQDGAGEEREERRLLVLEVTGAGGIDESTASPSGAQIFLAEEPAEALRAQAQSSTHTDRESRHVSLEALAGQTWKRSMIENPRAKLFTGHNYSGSHEDYDFRSATYKGGCYNLLNYREKINSVNTEGTCVRLFRYSHCTGWSQAMYPGSATRIDARLRGVRSVGPCVSNEFEYASLEDAGDGSGKVVKKVLSQVKAYKNVPDIIGDAQSRMVFTYFSNSSNPVYEYFEGYEGRVEAIKANIHSRHILTLEAVEARRLEGLKQSFYSNLLLDDEVEEVGYAIPLELGGPADQRYNAFVQSKEGATQFRAATVPSIISHQLNYPDNYSWLALNFMYESERSTRPSGFWYALHKYGLNELTYGYVPN